MFAPLFTRAFTDVASMAYFHEVPGISNVITAAVGDEFTLIPTYDGKVYRYGRNLVGQIGPDLDVEFSNIKDWGLWTG